MRDVLFLDSMIDSPVHEVLELYEVEALVLLLVVSVEDELNFRVRKIRKLGLEVTFSHESVVVLVQGGESCHRPEENTVKIILARSGGTQASEM
jgi:hypothetical protein